MSNDKTYNGWTNYETWCVNLWITNDEGSSSYWADAAQECWDDAEPTKILTRNEAARYALADRLKDELSDTPEEMGEANMHVDLLRAALSEVNWSEIAEAFLSAVDKTGDEE